MLELILYAAAVFSLAWLFAGLAFTFLSLGQEIMGLPRRFLDWLAGLSARRERKRVYRARRKRGMAVIEQIRRREF